MIVVTGAAGLIGSAVVRALNERGYTRLVLVDHLGSSEKWRNLRSLNYLTYFERDEFLEIADVLGRGDLSALPGGDDLECIIHLGANSSTTEKNATHLIKNNYRYSIVMAQLACQTQARFVYASSAATYGDGSEGFEDRMDEYLDSLRPLNAYGYSKHAFDLYLRNARLDLSFAGLKYFNVFGPNEYHKGDMRSVVHKAFEQIQDTGRMRLFKSYRKDYRDGEQKRDFLYVKDAAEMTVHLALDARDQTGLFNAGSGVASTWLSLGNAIFEAMNLEPNIEFVDMPEELREKYQYYTCAPIQRLRNAGYVQKITPLAKAVQDYVQNYLLREDPYA